MQFYGLDVDKDSALGLTSGLKHSTNRNYGNTSNNDRSRSKLENAESSEEENIAWAQTQDHMAQSQSNYVQSKIRSVKDIDKTTDFNIEEQLVIVELCEEYCRRGNFEMIFPRKDTVEKYKKYFKVQRACNRIVWKWLKLSHIMTSTVKHTSKTGRNAASNNDKSDTQTNTTLVLPKTRFSVLKNFNIRKNCTQRFIDDIKQI